MPIPLFGRSRNKIPPNATFSLTERGREKVQDFGSDPKSRILTDIEMNGTSDVEEIRQRTGISKGQIERLIPVLVRGGYIQYVGAVSSEV